MGDRYYFRTGRKDAQRSSNINQKCNPKLIVLFRSMSSNKENPLHPLDVCILREKWEHIHRPFTPYS